MRVFGLIKKYGIVGFVIKADEKLHSKVNRIYSRDCHSMAVSDEELVRQRGEQFEYAPLISIVVPAYNTDKEMLGELIRSVIAQSYGNWQLCIADAGESGSVKEVVDSFGGESRICYRKLAENGGISKNTNEGFKMATGEYIALLDHDDFISPDALYEVVKALNGSRVKPKLIYTDEDKISGKIYYAPHCKTGINRELLRHYNYVCHFLVFSKSLLERIGGLNSEYDGSQDYDFILRAAEVLKDEEIAHVGRIVYHWRVHSSSTAWFSGSKNYAYDAGIRALRAHFLRVGLERTKVSGVKGQDYIDSDRTAYADTDNAVFVKSPDIRRTSTDWQRRLAQYFTDKDVGITAGRIVSGGKVVSSGMSFDADGVIHHRFQGLRRCFKGYATLAKTPHEVGAVSLDFCAIRRDVYEKVGEINYNIPSPYRDMEYAMRVSQAGYKIVIDGRIEGIIPKRRLDISAWSSAADGSSYIEGWAGHVSKGDPFYNEITRICGDDHL